MLSGAWNKEPLKYRAHHVINLISTPRLPKQRVSAIPNRIIWSIHADRANSVSLWVAGMILLQPTSKTRRKMFSKFAVVAAVRHARPLLLDSKSLTQPDFTQHSN